MTHLIEIPSDIIANSRTASGVQKRVWGQIKSDLDWSVNNTPPVDEHNGREVHLNILGHQPVQ